MSEKAVQVSEDAHKILRIERAKQDRPMKEIISELITEEYE